MERKGISKWVVTAMRPVPEGSHMLKTCPTKAGPPLELGLRPSIRTLDGNPGEDMLLIAAGADGEVASDVDMLQLLFWSLEKASEVGDGKTGASAKKMGTLTPEEEEEWRTETFLLKLLLLLLLLLKGKREMKLEETD